MDPVQQQIDELVKTNEILLFMKGNANFPMCGFSGRAIDLLKASGVDLKALKTINVLEEPDIRQGIKSYSNWPTIPQLFIKGEFIGGSDIMTEMFETGELKQLIQS
jgi:monothiol glutaredoxin